MSRTKKSFDAVEMMRAARDGISAQIAGMTLEQQLRWLSSQEISDPCLKRLRDRASGQRRSASAPTERAGREE